MGDREALTTFLDVVRRSEAFAKPADTLAESEVRPREGDVLRRAEREFQV
ncbi:hypothetical protein [Embleya sp. NPDC005575]